MKIDKKQGSFLWQWGETGDKMGKNKGEKERGL